jgi:hypothetical protein
MSEVLKKSTDYDSTACMAAAWFGTPGCGDAIERVFGVKDKESNMEPKTDMQVKAPESHAKIPLFTVPDHGYVVDLSQVQGIGLVLESNPLTSMWPIYEFKLDLVGRPNSKPVGWVNTDADVAKRQAESAREALLDAWHKYKALPL